MQEAYAGMFFMQRSRRRLASLTKPIVGLNLLQGSDERIHLGKLRWTAVLRCRRRCNHEQSSLQSHRCCDGSLEFLADPLCEEAAGDGQME